MYVGLQNVLQRDCEFLSNLKQLYLSYNMIARFEDIASIALCRSLAEVALDSNPICQGSCYRIAAVKVPQLFIKQRNN